MSKFKAEFTLKQHTPIIHFQSKQSGATLRATELKPKFDRFLKKYAFDGEIPKEFLIDKDRDALDYKVTIEPNMTNPTAINDRDPLFFGNMGDGEKKKFKSYTKSFKITIFTYKTTLLPILKEQFEAFLANTNFGTRQSKGFGSFYLDKKFDKALVKYNCYQFGSSANNYKEDIKLFYSFLRQGINLPNREDTRFYSKPAIFSYAKSKGWTWDKKAIKQEYFNNILNTQTEKHNSDVLTYSSDEQYLLRDLFGLSSSQQWMSYRSTIEKEHTEQNRDTKIDRFKSPITFKVVDNIVYFWADDSVDAILDKEFNIKAGSGKNDLNLSTPKEFSFEEFFEFAFKINLATHIDEKYHTQKEYKTLVKIFNNLKAN